MSNEPTGVELPKPEIPPPVPVEEDLNPLEIPKEIPPPEDSDEEGSSNTEIPLPILVDSFDLPTLIREEEEEESEAESPSQEKIPTTDRPQSQNAKFREQRQKKQKSLRNPSLKKQKETQEAEKQLVAKANENREAEFVNVSVAPTETPEEPQTEELNFVQNSVGTLRKAYYNENETSSNLKTSKGYIGLEPPPKSSAEERLRKQRPKNPSTSMEVKNRFAVAKGFSEGILLKQASTKFSEVFRENKKMMTKDKESFPLHVACLLGQAEITAELLKAGAKVDLRNKAGYYPIHYAVAKASNHHSHIVQMLMHHGAKLDVKSQITGETPLHYAVLKAAPTKISYTVQLLLHMGGHKVDVNARDFQGQTPLHYACRLGFFQATKLLLTEKKIIPNLSDNFGYTPLHLAILANSPQCVDMLITKSPLISDITNWGETCLHLACKMQSPAILRILMGVLKSQPNSFHLLSKRDNKGFTAVHYAALQASVPCLQMFPHFADLTDNIGYSPIFWATLKGHRITVHHLLGLHVNFLDQHFGDVHYPMGEDFQIPLTDKSYSDLVLRIGNTSVSVHRVLLGRCLPQYSMTPDHEVQLQQEISPAEFQHFLTFIYTGKIPESNDEKKILRDISHVFGIPLLQSLLETALLTGHVDRTSNLTLYLGDILTTAKYSDATITVENHSFHVHRVVLACRSKYFADLFNQQPNQTQFVIPQGISKAMFQILLEFLYTDTIKKSSSMSNDALLEIWDMAKSFNLQRMAFKIELFFYEKLSPENAEEIFLMTEANDMPLLKEGTLDYLALGYKNLKRCNLIDQLVTGEWPKLFEKRSKELLKRKEKEDKESKKTKTRKESEPIVTHSIFFGIESDSSPHVKDRSSLKSPIKATPAIRSSSSSNSLKGNLIKGK